MVSWIMTDEILTLKEVAQYLKLAEKTAYRLAAEGKLPGFKVGGSWRFRRDEVEKLTKGEIADIKAKWNHGNNW